MKRRQNPDHLRRVRALPCIVCGRGPCHAHHIKTRPDGQKLGVGQKNHDDQTIPLCLEHHTVGPEAFHNGPGTFRERFGSELDLLERTRQMLDRQ